MHNTTDATNLTLLCLTAAAVDRGCQLLVVGYLTWRALRTLTLGWGCSQPLYPTTNKHTLNTTLP